MKKNIFALVFTLTLSYSLQISSISFEGLTHISQESAIALSGLKIGDEISEEKINDAILNLYKQNYFSDIEVEQEGSSLIFRVKQRQVIARIDITGVSSNDRKQIDTILGIKKGTLYDEYSLKEASQRIKLYYESKGYFDTVVEFNKENLGDSDALQVNFLVNRGENIIIENVILSGAKELSYSDVEPSLVNKKREFMGWMWGRNDGKLNIFELPNDSSRVADEYMKEGFLDVEVSPASLRVDSRKYIADLSFFIKEGRVYKISSIKIENPVFSEEENDKKIQSLQSEVGDVADIEKIRADINYIQTDTANLGYAFAQVYPDIQKDEINAEASIVFRVIPNDKVYIRDVIIKGNTRTVDRVIRRELYVTEGNLYHKDDLSESINALKRTSYFDDVKFEEKRINSSQIDLIVEVKEAATGAISGGVGFSSADGLLLNASYSDNNLLGSGMRSIVSVDKSYTYLMGRIGLTNPRLADSDYSLGGSLYANQYTWDNYSDRIYGGEINIGRRFARYFSAGFSYNLEQNDIYSLSQELILTGYELGKTIKSSVTPYISFNNTDDYYLPRKGIIASTSLEVAGVGGDQRFLTSSTSFNFYQGLKDFIGIDLIYRYKANFYKTWDMGNLPINQRFFLGGIGSVRGFENRTLSPKNIYGYEEGGTIAFTNSAELSFPLIDRIKLRGALFFDYGAIGREVLDVHKSKHRYSTGLSIEWITPFGPLQLVFAKPLNPKPGDEISTFEFTIGTRF
ncbi:outer membrane protein assembly factor BamA [uncultured Campylobacter sp.]|uniref:outer membrane protein assembly factor BamA n=1 Tax=uncultured Campylobacter sp. TaxID=218934 RepID=UPI002638CC35|nr:outer membrane protein assembly factor BamA [uncultured Campylobacter sp.]